MYRSPSSWILLALVACNGSTPTDDSGPSDDSASVVPATPSVSIDVTTVFLGVGERTQLVATTVDGDDSGYSWQSSAPEVATVDADGWVTGVSLGEVVVTATGADTGASAEVGLYVAHEVPFLDEWSGSAHAAHTDEAFVHWDDDGAVSASCARCHTTTGFRDYLGDDGSLVESVEADAPLGEVVECMACHNPAATALDTVLFPSGVRVDDLGAEARCMTCHQGRASKDSVDQKIADAGAAGAPDTPDADLSFTNIHYYAAGATLYAGTVRGGYQYDDLGGEAPLYDARFRHVSGFDTCLGCHDPHSLEVQVDACSECHTGVTDVTDLRDVRMMASSTVDYDGDGNVAEGLYYELQGTKEVLYAAIQAYAAGATDVDAICYDPASHPYFFIDGDGSGGFCDAAEVSSANRFATWTPRLLRAAYNYQVVSKDPGGFAHNGKYLIQLAHDSIRDLSDATATPVAFAGTRNDPGHFDGSAAAFRRWDSSEAVGASCSKCHGGAEGLQFYVEYGTNLDVLDKPNGMQCETCHPADYFRDASTTSLHAIDTVVFGGGKEVATSALQHPSDAICATCHSGRYGKDSIQEYLDDTTGTLSFRNVHYLPSAAMKYGSEAAVGWEYDGQTYAGADPHMPQGANSECTFCHAPAETGHTFQPGDHFDFCLNCHSGVPSVQDIRWFGNTLDYDGDGDTSEPLRAELASFEAAALDAIRAYAAANALGTPCYAADASPYWFNGVDPVCTTAEADRANRFTGFDAELIKATHNLHFVHKDPGSWAHNMTYASQLLYDSIVALDQDPGALTRP